MNLFDVYPRYDVDLVAAEGSYVYDVNGDRYLDLYGGHGVISIGHSHPHFRERIKAQLDDIAFYSNAVQNTIQEKYAVSLGEISGYEEYQLFLCNSGTEANEHALKIASMHTGRGKIISFSKAFHGRTSLSVMITDNTKLHAPVNVGHEVIRLEYNQEAQLEEHITDEVAAVILEPVQGVGGINVARQGFLDKINSLIKKHKVLLVMDEVQSGFGRTGKLFAHQHFNIQPDLITTAKGMGNGFPIGGVLIHPDIRPWYGMLGTTFGGNHLACSAGLAVIDVMKKENLLKNASYLGQYMMAELAKMEVLKELRGLGLMIGIDLPFPVKALRKKLVHKYRIFTGSSSNPYTLRLLPPLSVNKDDLDYFLESFYKAIKDEAVSVS